LPELPDVVVYLEALERFVVGHRLELCHQGPRLFELALSRMVFELRCHLTGHGGKRRHHAAKLVSGLTQPKRVLLSQGLLNGPQMIR